MILKFANHKERLGLQTQGPFYDGKTGNFEFQSQRNITIQRQVNKKLRIKLRIRGEITTREQLLHFGKNKIPVLCPSPTNTDTAKYIIFQLLLYSSSYYSRPLTWALTKWTDGIKVDAIQLDEERKKNKGQKKPQNISQQFFHFAFRKSVFEISIIFDSRGEKQFPLGTQKGLRQQRSGRN